MGLALGTRSMMTAQDCTAREFKYLLDLAGDLKSARHAGASVRPLDGRQICLLGDSGAARSRWAFEAACAGLGANLTRLDAGSARIGCAESFKDAARVLGRMFDAVEYQGPNRAGAQELARFAGVPVFDGLTTDAHVTQMIADVMTMREHGGRPAHELTYAFVGDTGSDMAQSLMIAGCLCGMDVRMCGPKQLWPGEEFIAMARRLQKQSGARLTITDDPKQGVDRADFVHTSAWLSAGGPKDVWKQRIDLLLKYQVNMDLMKAARNPHVKLLHCLPAHHDTLTTLGAQIAETFGLACGLEVTNDVFESEMNVAFEQAENRVHTIKAMLVATLAA